MSTAPKSSKKTTKPSTVATTAPAAEPVTVVEVSETKDVVKDEVKEASAVKPASAKTAGKPLAKRSLAKKVVSVVEVETEAEAETVESAPKKKLTVVKGEVTVVSGKKSPRASPRKTAVKKTAAKSPTTTKRGKAVAKSPSKKVAAKSPAKKAAATPKTGGRRVVRNKKTAKKTPTKPKRQHNVNPAPYDYAGLGIGPARVKKVLTMEALNPREAMVRKALLKAENRPVRPKPTKEVPAPELPAQGPQVPIEKLDAAVLTVVREAEKAHADSLMEDYEREFVKKFDDAKREAYQAARKEAQSKEGFNLHAFNLSHDKKFYDGLNAYCHENDSYQLTRKVKDDETGEEWDKYNQWTRATALVNKLCTRLSQETRNILAGYLDNLVIQYARNGLHNCLKDNRSIVQLHHALTVSDGFDDRVPLDAFARTLSNYQLALSWVEACRETREEVRQHKTRGHEVEAELPAYPDPEYNEDFDGYVVDLCRSVRIRMAEEQPVAANKQKFLDASISSDFKRFCSFLIYEAILRVGAILKAEVALNNVKTVSEKLMYHALHQIHNACGIDFESVREDLVKRLEKFSKWRAERRDARKAKHTAKDAAVEEDDDDEDVPVTAEDDVVADEADAAAEEEEAEEEEEEEAAEDATEEVEEEAAEEDAIEYADA